jgi:hypothetical protein
VENWRVTRKSHPLALAAPTAAAGRPGEPRVQDEAACASATTSITTVPGCHAIPAASPRRTGRPQPAGLTPRAGRFRPAGPSLTTRTRLLPAGRHSASRLPVKGSPVNRNGLATDRPAVRESWSGPGSRATWERRVCGRRESRTRPASHASRMARHSGRPRRSQHSRRRSRRRPSSSQHSRSQRSSSQRSRSQHSPTHPGRGSQSWYRCRRSRRFRGSRPGRGSRAGRDRPVPGRDRPVRGRDRPADLNPAGPARHRGGRTTSLGPTTKPAHLLRRTGCWMVPRFRRGHRSGSRTFRPGGLIDSRSARLTARRPRQCRG